MFLIVHFRTGLFQKVSYKSETKPFHGDDVISLIDKSRQLTRQQLFKHLCNFDDNFASTMEGKDQELSLSSLIKFYNDAQKQILERELRESIKYSASQSFSNLKLINMNLPRLKTLF